MRAGSGLLDRSLLEVVQPGGGGGAGLHEGDRWYICRDVGRDVGRVSNDGDRPPGLAGGLDGIRIIDGDAGDSGRLIGLKVDDLDGMGDGMLSKKIAKGLCEEGVQGVMRTFCHLQNFYSFIKIYF